MACCLALVVTAIATISNQPQATVQASVVSHSPPINIRTLTTINTNATYNGTARASPNGTLTQEKSTQAARRRQTILNGSNGAIPWQESRLLQTVAHSDENINRLTWRNPLRI